MPATDQERSAKRNAKRAIQGAEELRLVALSGTRTALAELMQWHGIEQQGEAMTLMIHNLRAMGRDGSAAAFAVPRHEIKIAPAVARKLESEGRRQAARLDQDE